MIGCSTEIKTRHTIFHDTAPNLKGYGSIFSFWLFH